MIHATVNKMAKITDTIFADHMQWAVSTIQTMIRRLRIISLAGKIFHVRYVAKKVYTWLSFVMQLEFYLLHTTQM